MKNSTPRRQLPKLQLLNFKAKTSLDEIIKSINSQTNNKSPGNDGLKAVFYKHFSNELAPVLLDVYDSWGKLGTISVTSRTGIISATYKKGDKRDIENYRPTSFLNLYYKIYTTILKGYLRYKTVFCHKVALEVQLMDFFNLKKKCFALEVFRFLCFCEIHRFQNL